MSFIVSQSVTSLFVLFIVSFGYGPILVYYNPIYRDFIIIVITYYYCFADIARCVLWYSFQKSLPDQYQETFEIFFQEVPGSRVMYGCILQAFWVLVYDGTYEFSSSLLHMEIPFDQHQLLQRLLFVHYKLWCMKSSVFPQLVMLVGRFL